MKIVLEEVTLPLSLPGVFAGTLLTFIPAAGDYSFILNSDDGFRAFGGNASDMFDAQMLGKRRPQVLPREHFAVHQFCAVWEPDPCLHRDPRIPVLDREVLERVIRVLGGSPNTIKRATALRSRLSGR